MEIKTFDNSYLQEVKSVLKDVFFNEYSKENTTLQVFNKKISYRTFQCIISLRQQLQRKVIPYDKLIIQQRKPDW